MSPEPRYICVENCTPLVELADDGARCSWRHHFHVRLPRGGYAGARPSPTVTYRDVELAEPSPALPTGRGEDGD